MINNGGAIVSECKIDGKLYKQAHKKNFLLCAAILGLSATGIIAFGILYSGKDDLILFICFCILFVLGAFLLIINLLAIKSGNLSEKFCKCELYAEYMLVSYLENGEKLSEAKVAYKDLFKCCELKNYFIAYANKTAFYPVCKDGLTEEEQNSVKKLFGLQPQQGACKSETAETAEANSAADNGENIDGSMNK